MRLTDTERDTLAEAVWPVDPSASDPGLRSLHLRVTFAVEAILTARLAAVEALVAGEPGGEAQPWVRKADIRAALTPEATP